MVTRTDVRETLGRVIEALAGMICKDEVAAAWAAVGTWGPRPSAQAAPSRTPLPGPGAAAGIASEVEWVWGGFGVAERNRDQLSPLP